MNETIPPHRRLDENGQLEYLCFLCGKPYERFERPQFLENNETVHEECFQKCQEIYKNPLKELQAWRNKFEQWYYDYEKNCLVEMK